MKGFLIAAGLLGLTRGRELGFRDEAVLVGVAAFDHRAEAGIVHTAPMLMATWTLSALVFALGLLGYAIETTSRRPS